jgi:hypothetical protein
VTEGERQRRRERIDRYIELTIYKETVRERESEMDRYIDR